MILEESSVIMYLIGGVVSFGGILLFAFSLYTGEAIDTLLVSLAPVAMGALLIFRTEKTITTITHETQTIQIQTKRLRSEKIRECRIDTVESVALMTNKRAGDSGEVRIHSGIVIIVDAVPIPLGSLHYATGRLERMRVVGQRLASVLGVPFNDSTYTILTN